MKQYLLWLSLALSFALLGCDDNPSPSGDTDAGPPPAPSCETDEDCPDGLCSNGTCMDVECFNDSQCEGEARCVNYQCQAGPSGCITDGDCDAGQRCDNGACVPGDFECTTHDDCPEGVCVDHQCVAEGPDCAEDADCPEDLVCLEGVCQADPSCAGDEDCAEGESCINGVCEGSSPGCLEDADCGEMEICLEGICVEAMECVEDTDCEEGDLCVEGACVDLGDECVTDDECDLGLICDAGLCVEPSTCETDADCGDMFICVEGACVRPEATPCDENTDCPVGEACQGEICVLVLDECAADEDCGEGAFCLGGYCFDSGSDCAADEDCAEGLSCFDGYCLEEIPECIEDVHCGANMACDMGVCVELLECEADEDCDLDYECIENACVPMSAECEEDVDCGEGFACDMGVCVELPPECAEDVDCEDGFYCDAGVCVEFQPECVEDGDCGEGFSCQMGVCVEIGPECAVDEDCEGEWVCDAGVCVEPEPECVIDEDCPEGFACEMNACVEITPECAADGDCGEGFLCVEGECLEEVPECLTGEDCDEGFGCDQGVCVELPPECMVDEDCGPGFACDMGVCVELPPECVIDADCAEGLECDMGFCVEPQPECVADVDCGEGFYCEMGQCLELQPDCAADEDCAAGFICVEGVCAPWTPECLADEDCAEGSICVEGACQEANCVNDADCAVNEVCAEGLCVVPECDGDMDCGEGMLCEHGACVEPPPECVIDVDCDAGFVCDMGVCLPIPPECLEDLDCAAGEVCLEGACVEPPPECVLNIDCGADMACVDNVCVPIVPDCAADEDCAEGEVCLDGSCMLTQGDDACALENILLVEQFGVYEGTTLDRPADYEGTCGGVGPEQVIFIALAEPTPICVTVVGYDAVLHARTTCEAANAQVACNDDLGADTSASQIQIDAEAETPYYVFIDSYSEPGDFQIEIIPEACPILPECVTDEDCDVGFACVEGACELTPPECLEDIDCPEGEVCVAERCEPIQPECAADEDCPEGFLCDAGQCVEIPPECVVAEDCGPGFICDAGVCVEVQPECVVAEDCPEGFLCDAGQCVEIPPECVIAEDCGPGFICVDGACEPAPPECIVDLDCAPGFLCVEGTCVEGGPNSCDPDQILVPQAPPFEGDTTDALANHAGSCGGAGGPEHVYGFAMPADIPPMELCVSTFGYDTVLHVRAGDCFAEGNEIGCDDDGLNDGEGGSFLRFDAQPGEVYFFFVDSFEGGGAYEMLIEQCPPDPECQVDADCAEGQICVDQICVDSQGDTCDVDQLLLFEGEPPYVGDTTGGFANHVGSCGGAGPERAYGFAVAEPVELCAAAMGYDTTLYIREGDCGAGLELACDDNGLQDGQGGSFIRFMAQPDLNYFLFVDSVAPEGGAYEVQIGLCPPPPCQVDADCAEGEICDVDSGACVPGPECVIDEDCGEGFVCVDGACEVYVPNACDADQITIVQQLGDIPGSTIGQVGAHNATCGNTAQGPEDVYAFAVGEPLELCLSVEGYDTVMHLRQDGCFQGAELECDDDGLGNGGSALRFTAQPGVDYFLFIDSYDVDGGDYTLHFETCPPPPCAVDEDCGVDEVCDVDQAICVPAPECAIDADCAPGFLCLEGACVEHNACNVDELIPVEAFGDIQGSTAGQVGDHLATCGSEAEGPEDVYVFAVNGELELCLSVEGYDTVMHLRQDDCAGGAELACNDDDVDVPGNGSALRFTAQPDVDYFLFVDSYGADGGDYTLHFEPCPPPPCAVDEDCAEGEICDVDQAICVPAPACVVDADCQDGFGCLAGACVEQASIDACDPARMTPVLALGDIQGTTAGQVNGHLATCGSEAEGPEDVYFFSVGAELELCLSVEGYDTVMHLRQDDCASGAELECNDDGVDIPNNGSELRFTATPDVTYFLFIDSYYAAGGDYTLHFEACPPPPCAVDEDCGVDEVCDVDSGACVPAPECVVDADCLDGFGCLNGACVEQASIDACDPGRLIPVQSFGDIQGSTSGQVGAYSASCSSSNAAGPEDVYVFGVGGEVDLCLSVEGYDTVMHLRQDTCADGAELACDDDSGPGLGSEVRFTAMPDVTYFLFVDSYDQAGGDYTLHFEACPPDPCAVDADCADGDLCDVDQGFCFTPECIVDADCADGEVCDLNSCMAPSACNPSELIPLLSTGRYMGSTLDQDSTLESSCRSAGPSGGEDVYVLQVGAPLSLCMSTTGYDTVMHTRQDDCLDEGAELLCNDDGGVGTGSALRIDAEVGATYYVVVDSYSSNGEYALDVDVCPEAGSEECSVNADCPQLHECINGLCKTPAECYNDANCADVDPSFICELGVCVPGN